MPMFDNVGGGYRQVGKSYSNIGGGYREDKKVFDNIGGGWRETHSGKVTYIRSGSDLSFTWTFADPLPVKPTDRISAKFDTKSSSSRSEIQVIADIDFLNSPGLRYNNGYTLAYDLSINNSFGTNDVRGVSLSTDDYITSIWVNGNYSGSTRTSGEISAWVTINGISYELGASGEIQI